MRAVSIRTEGMYCRYCPLLIQCRLSRLAGIESARTDLDSALTSVVFDPKLIAESAIRDHIQSCGYGAKIVSVVGASARPSPP